MSSNITFSVGLILQYLIVKLKLRILFICKNQNSICICLNLLEIIYDTISSLSPNSMHIKGEGALLGSYNLKTLKVHVTKNRHTLNFQMLMHT